MSCSFHALLTNKRSSIAPFIPGISPSQALPQPIPQLRLSKLRQIVHSLLAQIDALQIRNVLCRRLADSLHDDRWVCLENNAVVYDFVKGEGE